MATISRRFATLMDTAFSREMNVDIQNVLSEGREPSLIKNL